MFSLIYSIKQFSKLIVPVYTTPAKYGSSRCSKVSIIGIIGPFHHRHSWGCVFLTGFNLHCREPSVFPGGILLPGKCLSQGKYLEDTGREKDGPGKNKVHMQVCTHMHTPL